MSEPLLLKPEEAADALRIGRTELFRLLSSGAIESVMIGERCRRVPFDALQRYVESLRREPVTA